MHFLITLIVCLHIFACIWANLGKTPDGSVTSWVTQKDYLFPNWTDASIYLGALYWSSTVFATIGYGDFMGFTTLDYVFTMFVFVRSLD